MIVIAPGKAERPAGDVNSDALGEFGEFAIALIVIERDGAALKGDSQIRPAVIVVIARSASDGVSGFEAGRTSDIGEMTRAVIAEKRRMPLPIAIREKNSGMPRAVEIENTGAGTPIVSRIQS